MRRLIAVAAVAPFALLAACGDSTPVEEVEPEPMDTMGLETPDPVAVEPVPEASLENVDFAGDYAMTGLDGSISTITLDPTDDSYEYTAGDGTSSSGNFTRMDDGQRIMIEDFDGRAGYFAIGDGAIYRLPDAYTGADQITVTGMYERRDPDAAEDPSASEDGSIPENASSTTDEPAEDEGE